jgi:hypothetical protein
MAVMGFEELIGLIVGEIVFWIVAYIGYLTLVSMETTLQTNTSFTLLYISAIGILSAGGAVAYIKTIMSQF